MSVEVLARTTLMPDFTRFMLRGRRVLLKRDDLISLSSGPSGNKARKLLSLSNRHPAELSDVVSYGGAQSNMMAALSELCSAKGWRFHYLMHEGVPSDSTLAAHKESNFARAMGSGCFQPYRVHRSLYDSAHENSDGGQGDAVRANLVHAHGIPRTALWIPQGGAGPEAMEGCSELASELQEMAQLCGKELVVAIPSGTGTTALLTAAHCDSTVSVIAVPCVGSARQLRQQIEKTAAKCNVSAGNVQVLEPLKRIGFGHPCKKVLRSWMEVCDAADVTFDLVYGGPAWHVLLQHDELWNDQSGKQFCYVHSGGMGGHVTQLERYRRRGYL